MKRAPPASRQERPTRSRQSPPMAFVPSRHQPSFAVPTDWSPEQAAAVFELVDALLAQVWSTYHSQIQQLLREQYSVSAPEQPIHIDETDLPF